MKHIYVVTHPESSHHVGGLVGGWFNRTLLTPRGLEHAENISSHLRSLIPPDASVTIHSSDLNRCQQTARAISREFGGIPYTSTESLREISFGEADGKPQAFLDERYIFPPAPSSTNNQTERLDHDFGIVGAETRRQVVERVYGYMKDNVFPLFRSEGVGDDYQIVVTHGFTATFVTAAWIGLPVESAGDISIASTPGGITHLRQDDLFHNRAVVGVNMTAHLEGGAKERMK